jgi:hypothetical protein
MPTTLVIAPGRILRRDHKRYRAGTQAPSGLSDAYIAAGLKDKLFTRVELRADAPPPTKGEAVERTFVHPEWSPGDPESIAGVPVKVIPQLLASLATAAKVEAVRDAEAAGKKRSTVARFCRERIKQIGS